MVMGQTESGSWEVQAIRYHKGTWDENTARESCSAKNGSFEPASATHSSQDFYTRYVSMAEDLPEGVSLSWTEDGKQYEITSWPTSDTSGAWVADYIAMPKIDGETLRGQEIFATGTWNGDSYSEADLDGIVHAFYKNAIGRPVPLKLGHDEAQKFFGQASGAPALGWVENLRRMGTKLVADFVNVPTKIADLMKRKLYRGKSAEIYWDFRSSAGELWPRALKAVSLLGADLPAVTNLNELHEALMQEQLEFAKTYGAASEELVCKQYEYGVGEGSGKDQRGGNHVMDAAKEKEYSDRIQVLTEEVAKAIKRAEEGEARAVKAEASLAERDETHAVAQFTTKVESLVKEGKILPPQKDGIIATFRALPVTKTVDGKEVKPREEFVASLDKLPKIVKFGETGAGGEGTGEGDGTEHPALTVDKLAKKYMVEQKLSYGDAIGKVRTEHVELWQSYLSNRRA